MGHRAEPEIRHAHASQRIRGSALPIALQRLAKDDPAFTATVRGNPDLLNRTLVGFFCSESAPGDAILGTYDLALALRDSNATFIGGFQSAVEKEFLAFVIRGSASVIVCPPRGIGRMRLPAAWRAPLEAGRMLVLSIFDDKVRRPTGQIVAKRNAFVAELAACLLVPHAEPSGKVEGLCETALARGKPVFTLANPGSRLVDLGAEPMPLQRRALELVQSLLVSVTP